MISGGKGHRTAAAWGSEMFPLRTVTLDHEADERKPIGPKNLRINFLLNEPDHINPIRS